MNAHSLFRLCFLVTGAAVLASCGGGGGNSSGGPAVNTLAAGNARMGGTSTITVSGRNLREGIAARIEGPCETLTTVANGTDDTQQYTCDVRGVGEIRVIITDTKGTFLARLAFQVPMPQVSVVTGSGTFVLDLDAVKAPLSTLNFLAYVNAGFYRNVLIDRVIRDRGIASGGFTTGLVAKAATRAAIALESNNGLKNLRGTVGVLREGGPVSGRARWYINTADNADLDFVDEANPGFAVFGTVSSGMSVVDAISAVETRVDLLKQMTDIPVGLFPEDEPGHEPVEVEVMARRIFPHAQTSLSRR